jgi:hypothetical protein
MNCSKSRRVCIVMGLVWLSFGARAAFGQLLVSDYVTNEVLQYGLDGTFQKQLIGPQNPLSKSDLLSPSAMALGNGNDLFVASKDTGEVLRYNRQTGEFLNVFASGIYAPGGLLFDSAHNTLFVSEYGTYSDGNLIDRFDGSTRASLGSFSGGAAASGLSGMAMGSDGLLYASSFYNGNILRFNPTTGDSAIFANGSAVGLGGTNALVFDKTGNLDAVGLMSSNVYQFGSDGTPIRELIPAGNGLVWPCSMLMSPDGNLLVSNMGDGTSIGYIGEYNINTGAAINPFFIAGAGGLYEPSSMLIMPTPEPSTLAMLLMAGIGCLAWRVRRRWLGQ